LKTAATTDAPKKPRRDGADQDGLISSSFVVNPSAMAQVQKLDEIFKDDVFCVLVNTFNLAEG
jgi:hypothetical protein